MSDRQLIIPLIESAHVFGSPGVDVSVGVSGVSIRVHGEYVSAELSLDAALDLARVVTHMVAVGEAARKEAMRLAIGAP